MLITLTTPETFKQNLKKDLTHIEICGMYYVFHDAYVNALLDAGEDHDDYPAFPEDIDATDRLFQFAPNSGAVECCNPMYFPGFEKYGTVSRLVLTQNHIMIMIIEDSDENETWVRLN